MKYFMFTTMFAGFGFGAAFAGNFKLAIILVIISIFYTYLLEKYIR